MKLRCNPQEQYNSKMQSVQEQQYISEITGKCVFILSPAINYCTLNSLMFNVKHDVNLHDSHCWTCCLCTVGQVVHMLPEGIPVGGVTSLAGEVYLV